MFSVAFKLANYFARIPTKITDGSMTVVSQWKPPQGKSVHLYFSFRSRNRMESECTQLDLFIIFYLLYPSIVYFSFNTRSFSARRSKPETYQIRTDYKELIISWKYLGNAQKVRSIRARDFKRDLCADFQTIHLVLIK